MNPFQRMFNVHKKIAQTITGFRFNLLPLQDTAELFFDDVRVPSSALLGKLNAGFYYLMQELPQERLLIALMGQASNEFMFETTRQYVRERKAFGKTLANLQVILHSSILLSLLLSFPLFIMFCFLLSSLFSRSLNSLSLSISLAVCLSVCLSLPLPHSHHFL